MPIVLLIVGAVFLIAAIRGTHRDLGDLLTWQFTGEGSFLAWAFAIFMIALLGTIEPLRPLARALLALVLLVLILVHSRETNLFTLLQAQLLVRAGLRNTVPNIERSIP